MIIKEEYVYLSQEVADAFNMHIKQVTRLAKKHNIPKVGKGYEFSGKFLMKHFKIPEGEVPGHVLEVSDNVREMSVNVREVSETKSFNEYLNQPHKNPKTSTKLEDENEALKSQIESLEERLQQFDKKPNERIEIFTEADYVIFEQRLKEWRLQDQQIKLLDEKKTHSDRLFKELDRKNIEQNYENRFLKRENGRLEADNEQKRGLIAELVEFTKRLGATLETQSKDLFTKTAMEAKKTDWSNKDKK